MTFRRRGNDPADETGTGTPVGRTQAGGTPATAAWKNRVGNRVRIRYIRPSSGQITKMTETTAYHRCFPARRTWIPTGSFSRAHAPYLPLLRLLP